MDWLSWVELVGWAAAAAGLYSSYARTMIPLRVAAIVCNVLFIAYGLLKGIGPTVLANMVLLPLNFIRLGDMQRLVKRVQSAAETDLNMEWLRPYLTRRCYKAGDTIWHLGQAADEAMCVLAGEVELVEVGARVGPGALIGEMGLFSPNQSRMATARCLTDVEVGSITSHDFRILYFQNPEFGLYLMGLVMRRTQDNMRRMTPAPAR